MLALTIGCALRASVAARARKGRKLSLVLSRASKSLFILARRRATLVRSTSTTVVSWVETCSDSTMRVAMTLRSLVIFFWVPRFGETDVFVLGAVDVTGVAGAVDAAGCAVGAGSAGAL